jgi:hypothetical protein
MTILRWLVVILGVLPATLYGGTEACGLIQDDNGISAVAFDVRQSPQNACKLPPPPGSSPKMLGVGINYTSSFISSVGTLKTGM